MALKLNDLLEEFFETQKTEYPELSLVRCKEICQGPWRFLRRVMSQRDLPSVRFMYFGIFKVKIGAVKKRQKQMDERFAKGYMQKKEYDQYSEILTEYLEKHEKK